MLQQEADGESAVAASNIKRSEQGARLNGPKELLQYLDAAWMAALHLLLLLLISEHSWELVPFSALVVPSLMQVLQHQRPQVMNSEHSLEV